jgi:hypothetical protein
MTPNDRAIMGVAERRGLATKIRADLVANRDKIRALHDCGGFVRPRSRCAVA